MHRRSPNPLTFDFKICKGVSRLGLITVWLKESTFDEKVPSS